MAIVSKSGTTFLDEKVIELHEAGKSVREIAREVGISKSSVQKRVNPLSRVRPKKGLARKVYVVTRTDLATGNVEDVVAFCDRKAAELVVELMRRFTVGMEWDSAFAPLYNQDLNPT